MNQQSSLHGVTLQRPNRGHALNRHWELQTCFCRAAVLVRSCWIWRVSPRSLSHASSSRPGFAIDKFHILQHANAAVDEVRRAEFFRQGCAERALVKGKRWLLLSRWEHLNKQRKGQLESLFALNRRLMKAYLLKESLDGLWTFRYEGPCCATSRTGSRSCAGSGWSRWRSWRGCCAIIWMASWTTAGSRCRWASSRPSMAISRPSYAAE